MVKKVSITSVFLIILLKFSEQFFPRTAAIPKSASVTSSISQPRAQYKKHATISNTRCPKLKAVTLRYLSAGKLACYWVCVFLMRTFIRLNFIPFFTNEVNSHGLISIKLT